MAAPRREIPVSLVGAPARSSLLMCWPIPMCLLGRTEGIGLSIWLHSRATGLTLWPQVGDSYVRRDPSGQGFQHTLYVGSVLWLEGAIFWSPSYVSTTGVHVDGVRPGAIWRGNLPNFLVLGDRRN